jgi:hypothetical protein
VDKRAVAKNIYNYSCYSVMEGSIGIS